jgi:hypothetical protein
LLGTTETFQNLRGLAEVAGFLHFDELEQWQTDNGEAADYKTRWQQFLESLH